MSILPFISDSNLTACVDELLEKAVLIKTEQKKNFNKNTIDPFSMLFQMSGFCFDYRDWQNHENYRQIEKSLQNQVGLFHQKILGCIEDWENLGTGHIVDLCNKNKKIIAEVKNKYNTVSGGQLSKLYDELENAVSNKTSIYKGFAAYYVCIIPKNAQRYDRPFSPSNREKGQKRDKNQQVREIDGASFYSLVTGFDNALRDLYFALPKLIEMSKSNIKGYQFSELDVIQSNFALAYGE